MNRASISPFSLSGSSVFFGPLLQSFTHPGTPATVLVSDFDIVTLCNICVVLFLLNRVRLRQKPNHADVTAAISGSFLLGTSITFSISGGIVALPMLRHQAAYAQVPTITRFRELFMVVVSCCIVFTRTTLGSMRTILENALWNCGQSSIRNAVSLCNMYGLVHSYTETCSPGVCIAQFYVPLPMTDRLCRRRCDSRYSLHYR